MATGISIGITSDTRAFQQGVKSGVIDPLDDVEDTLKDLSKQGDKTGDSLTDAMKDAQKATEKNERSTAELVAQLKKTGKAGKDAGGDIETGMRKAGEGTENFKEEANATAKETAASFDGSAESIAGAFQEVAANAFAGFGPAGAAAGLVAAAGIGLAVSAIQGIATQSEETKQKVADMFDDMAESGNNYVSAELVTENLKALAQDTNKQNDALRIGNELGLSQQKILAAMAGDASALADVQAAAASHVADTATAYQEAGSALRDANPALEGAATKAAIVAQQVNSWATDITTASGQAKLFRDSLEEATKPAHEISDVVRDIPKTVPLTVTADTSAAKKDIGALTKQPLKFDVQLFTRNGMRVQ